MLYMSVRKSSLWQIGLPVPHLCRMMTTYIGHQHSRSVISVPFLRLMMTIYIAFTTLYFLISTFLKS